MLRRRIWPSRAVASVVEHQIRGLTDGLEGIVSAAASDFTGLNEIDRLPMLQDRCARAAGQLASCLSKAVLCAADDASRSWASARPALVGGWRIEDERAIVRVTVTVHVPTIVGCRVAGAERAAPVHPHHVEEVVPEVTNGWLELKPLARLDVQRGRWDEKPRKILPSESRTTGSRERVEAGGDGVQELLAPLVRSICGDTRERGQKCGGQTRSSRSSARCGPLDEDRGPSSGSVKRPGD